MERIYDYDLRACLDYNSQPFALEEVQKVLAIWEGEGDGDYWRWVLQLTGNRFAFLMGWCDYTGWDCQSGAQSKITGTADAAVNCALLTEFTEYSYLQHPSPETVHASLSRQLTEGVDETWRKRMDAEYGIGWDTPIITPSLATPARADTETADD